MSLLRALVAAALGAAILLPAALLGQAAPPSAQARGYAALLPGGAQGGATATTGGPAERTASVGGLRPAGGGTVASVSVRVGASSAGTGATAEGSITASGLRLLDGRVTVASLRMAARAGDGTDAGATGLTSSGASGVTVDGAPVPVGPGSRVAVPGVGALVFFETVADGTGGLRANALRVEVTDPAAAAVIGQPFVIGHLDLVAERGAAPAAEAPADPPATTRPAAPATAPRAAAAPDPAAIPLAATPSLGLPVRPAPRAAVVSGDGYVFPVVGDDVGFTDDYAAPRAGTGWHHGNDLFAPTGTPLVAVADGTLSRVGVNTLGGNRLWLTDDAGNAFYYAHLSAYAPAAVEGARVSAGQVIGFVGNTGQAITTPPHLHFEIHPAAGDSVNPYPYLLAWQRGGDIPRAFAQAATSSSPAPAAGAVLVDGVPEVDVAPAPADGLATPAS
ncbi:M23 family metallopeptidase [Miltoncostaea oceani]|uniref:M23 family metallopeptidase n=1 Tax=Miltoncostaea oceani TaxID=2843216 RepID=UPI001C3D33B4|nr:M23 family metallopeptidase [Miltoncostaea oceani]